MNSLYNITTEVGLTGSHIERQIVSGKGPDGHIPNDGVPNKEAVKVRRKTPNPISGLRVSDNFYRNGLGRLWVDYNDNKSHKANKYNWVIVVS